MNVLFSTGLGEGGEAFAQWVHTSRTSLGWKWESPLIPIRLCLRPKRGEKKYEKGTMALSRMNHG